MGLRSSGLSTWSMVGQSSFASAAEAASPFCFESEERRRWRRRRENGETTGVNEKKEEDYFYVVVGQKCIVLLSNWAFMFRWRVSQNWSYESKLPL